MKIFNVSILIPILLALFLASSGSVYAVSSNNVYTLSVGERPIKISYNITNATIDRIYAKEHPELTEGNPNLYSLVVDIGNSTKAVGTLTLTVPSELMASVCQSNFLMTKPKVSIDNNTLIMPDILSSTKTNITFLVKLPPFSKTVEVGGYGPDPAGGCPTRAYNLVHNGREYTIDYKSDPSIWKIIMNETNPAIVVIVNDGYAFPPQPQSFVDIQIPRDLLDAKSGQKDVPFSVTVDGNKTQIEEIETTDTTRTIHIPLPGAGYYITHPPGKIVITGTTAIPEFPTTTIVIISAIGLMIIFGRSNIWSRLYRKTK
jgi:hypothetical protein